MLNHLRLIRDGFAFDRGSGSHQIYRHDDGRRVTVKFHAKWTEDDLKRLKLTD
jgi:predicted RNA binding protein YcfA (HicA-like mRNA interferase family)